MVNVHVMILPYWFFVQTFSTVSKEAPIKRLSKKMDALKIWAISLQSAYGWWDSFFSKFARWRSSAVLKIISFTNILQDFWENYLYKKPFKDCLRLQSKGVCILISFHHKDFSWRNKIIRCIARVQVSNNILWKYFCTKDLHLCLKGVHKKGLQAGNCANKFKLNLSKPRQVKGNSHKLSKNQQ